VLLLLLLSLRIVEVAAVACAVNMKVQNQQTSQRRFPATRYLHRSSVNVRVL
jgi:hypothetical protein